MSNGNDRGSSRDRAARRQYILDTYGLNGVVTCYRCDVPLLMDGPDAFTIDRITPGCKGGTYSRNNIRPACAPCNFSTGAFLKYGVTA